MPELTSDLAFPAALAEAAAIGFDWEWDEEEDVGIGSDFEFYPEFEDPARTAWWLRLWTGNPEVDGAEFRFFGTTGAGDYAGFWLARPGADVAAQPVVYVGSEGEAAVIARDLPDLLWLFAEGLGPREAVDGPDGPVVPNEEFRALADRRAPGRRLPSAEIIAAAHAEFPHFEAHIRDMCR